VLESFPWSFATKRKVLALTAIQPTTTEWLYSYQYPSDCGGARRIVSGYRVDTNETRVPFRVIGAVIYTNQPEAELEYNLKQVDASLYNAAFCMALSYLLAVNIAPRVAGGDEHKLGPRSWELYRAFYMTARANTANEGADGPPPDAEWITARDR